MNNNFVLLYNTLGYEKRGTKKALVRTVDAMDETEIGTDSAWTLLDESGKTVTSGNLIYRGISFGIQMWEAVFTEISDIGRYTLQVQMKKCDGTILFEDTSLPFKIEENIYTNNLLLPLTLYNAQARVATEEHGGGFYDCNTSMGEAYSHGIFLNGMVQTYVMYGENMSDAEKEELHDMICVAFDYLVALRNTDTGEFVHAYPTRFNADVNMGLHNSIEALYGFVCCLYHFKGADPVRANDENYKKALQSVEYILNADRTICETILRYNRFYCDLYHDCEYMLPIYYYLYRYAGDETILEKGIALLEKILENYDPRVRNRVYEGIPVFEGVYLFMKLLGDHPRYATWIRQLKRISDTYFAVLPKKNAFGVISISGPQNAFAEWEDMSKAPTAWQMNHRRAINALNACFIGELLCDPALEEVVAGELGYIMGLNPGVAGKYVTNPDSDAELTVASFVTNMPGRFVRCWYYWDFEMKNNKWMSIQNGHMMKDGKYVFLNDGPDDWYYGEVFIMHDGLFAYAFCMYERYLTQLEENK